MNLRVALCCFFLNFLIAVTLAQQPDDGSVQIVAKATKTTIKLRWAPTSPKVWQYANQYGYTLEKIIFLENGKIIQNRKLEVIPSSPFKPKPLSEWEKVIEEDDYAAVAGQSIYGESFDVTENFSSEIAQIINRARELENRFSFAVHASDMSIKAAEWSGLYYEDEEVYNDYTYLYRIYVNAPAEKLVADTSTVLVGLDDYHELPVVSNVTVEFSNQFVKIGWSSLLSDYYSAYWVEKSEDGEHFTKITDTPIVFPIKGDRPAPPVLTKLDSLQDNNKTYYYRIAGVDAFGDVGPPSEVVSGQGLPGFRYAPVIEEAPVNAKGGVTIEWSFPDAGAELLKSFSLFRENPNTHRRELISEGISGKSRSVEDSLPHSTNYYIVAAYDIYGRSTTSFPFLVQLEDSIPTSAPSGLQGRIDTLGQVWLEWTGNPETDLYGYKLYRSNFEEGPFIQVPGPIITTTNYVDTLYLKTLTEEVFYRLEAYDKHYNPSVHSSILRLEKPDLLPPLTPVFHQVSNDSLGILVSWEHSPSDDVEKYLLYRRSVLEENWLLVKIFDVDELTFYLDKEVEHKVLYAYTLIAVDDDGLESSPANPVTMKWIDPQPYSSISDFYNTVDENSRQIQLSWNYSNEQVEKYLIYKSSNGAPMSLYKTTDSGTKEIIDHYKISDVTTEYRVTAILKNGETIPFSKSVRFDFQED